MSTLPTPPRGKRLDAIALAGKTTRRKSLLAAPGALKAVLFTAHNGHLKYDGVSPSGSNALPGDTA